MTAKSAPLVLVATTGTRGDMLPFIALARGLRDRGHRVRLLAPTFHESLIAAAGLDPRTFGTPADFQAALDNPDLWDERKGFEVIWKGAEPHLDVLRGVVAQLPADERCVLLCHPLLVPLADLARPVRPGLRVVAVYLAPSNLCSAYDLSTLGSVRVPAWLPLSARRLAWRLIHRVWIDPVMLPGLNAARRAHGMPAVSSFFQHMLRSPEASIGLFPSWFAAPQPDWPTGFVQGGFPVVDSLPPSASSTQSALSALSAPLERFLSAGEAPIAFTPGTGHRHAASYFATALEVLRRSGRRGLLITPHAAQVPPDLPVDVMWVAEAPFVHLLPRLAALVHHGGIGTTAEALRAGVPQVVVPFAFDQFDNAWRARRLGVAEVVLARRASVRRIRKALDRLLSSASVAQACREVARRVANGPSPGWLMAQVEHALGA